MGPNTKEFGSVLWVVLCLATTPRHIILGNLFYFIFLALCTESFELPFQYTDADLYFPFLISYTIAEFKKVNKYPEIEH